MGPFRKMRQIFHDDWCSRCTAEMEVIRKQLYMMPMYVGHYVSHEEPEYYKKNLIPVSKKADIPTGRYACGAITYRCPNCGHRAVKLDIFLPVRGVEKREDARYYERGEMDDFLWQMP